MRATTKKKKRSGEKYRVDDQTVQQNNSMNSFNEYMKPSSCQRGNTARRSHTSSKDRRKLLTTVFAAGNAQMSDAAILCGQL